MKRIQQITLAFFMTCAAMPAWGMYLSSIIAEKPSSIQRNGLMPFEEKDDFEVIRVFRNSFYAVPSLYFSVLEKKAPGEIRVWKENNRIEGALILEKKSPVETYIDYAAVDKNTQRRGIGTKMLNALEKEVAATCPQSSCIITLHSYAAALSFYAKNGFSCGYSNKCTKEIPSKNVSAQSQKDTLVWKWNA